MKKEDLKKFNGKEGNPAYISYGGKIYDVTGSRLWKDGVHMGRHSAGEDLTDFLGMAPHGEEVLERVTETGSLERDSADTSMERKAALSALYRKFHPHPMFIHFPIALYVFAMLLQSIFFFTGAPSLELSAYYSLIFGTLMIFPAIMSGFISWWINYDLTATTIFKNKIFFSFLLLIMGLTEVAIRTMNGEASYFGGSISLTYNIMVYLNVPVTVFIAYNGGKITFPS